MNQYSLDILLLVFFVSNYTLFSPHLICKKIITYLNNYLLYLYSTLLSGS